MLVKPVKRFFRQIHTEPKTNRNRFPTVSNNLFHVSALTCGIDCNA